jgi:ATP-dependent protease ClpP protease subunit
LHARCIICNILLHSVEKSEIESRIPPKVKEYFDEFETIRNMSPIDLTILHINGPGGNADTAIQFIRCIQETKGAVLAIVEGMCASAYTFIFLACHGWDISEHSTFMCHNYSGGMFGKGNELWERAQHDQQWSIKLLRETYKDFLSDGEIDRLIDGKDYWMTPDQVRDRCKVLGEARDKEEQEMQEALEEVMCEGCEESVLPDIKVDQKEDTFFARNGGHTLEIYPDGSWLLYNGRDLKRESATAGGQIDSDYEIENLAHGFINTMEYRKTLQKFLGCNMNLSTENMEQLLVTFIAEVLRENED